MELHRQRLPASRPGTLDDPAIGLVDQSEGLFEIRNQFLCDGIAPRAVIGRVERIGFKEIGAGCIERDRNHARKILARPYFRDMIAGLHIGIGRSEELRVGKESVSTWRSGGTTYH